MIKIFLSLFVLLVLENSVLSRDLESLIDAITTSKGPLIVPKYIKQGCDYCSLSSRNTYCIYGFSESVGCRGVISSGIKSESVKQQILDVHNKLRRKVANGQTGKLPGTASNMMKLVWNDELARGAQLWANQCQTEHDEPNTCKHTFVGQNIAWSHASGETEEPDFKTAIERWYDEINLFGGGVDEYYFNSATGHFTQLIWARTYEIGCGFVAYTGGKRQSDAIQKIYICNYGPGGNAVGSPIYKRGARCSKCPLGFGKCEDSLCVSGPGGIPDEEDNEEEEEEMTDVFNPYEQDFNGYQDPYGPQDPYYAPSPPPYNPYNPYGRPPPTYNPYGYSPYGYGPYNYGTTLRYCKKLLKKAKKFPKQ